MVWLLPRACLQQLGLARCHSRAVHTIPLSGIRYIPINFFPGTLQVSLKAGRKGEGQMRQGKAEPRAHTFPKSPSYKRNLFFALKAHPYPECSSRYLQVTLHTFHLSQSILASATHWCAIFPEAGFICTENPFLRSHLSPSDSSLYYTLRI